MLDPETGSIERVFPGGCGEYLPSNSGKFVAYLEAEGTCGIMYAYSSELRIYQVQQAQGAAILQDEARLISPKDWSPNEKSLVYLAFDNPITAWTATFGVIDIDGTRNQEIDLASRYPGAEIRGILWQDNSHVVLLVNMNGGRKAVLYEASTGHFSAGWIKKLGEFPLDDENVNLNLIYVPAAGIP